MVARDVVQGIRDGIWGAAHGVVALTFWAAAVSSSAAPLTWSGGAGTWNTATTNWLSSSGSVAWPSSGIDNDGVFGGSSATVTLSGGVLANELLFTATGYSVQGTGTITLNGVAPTITVSTGSAAIGNNTLATLAGVSGFTKAGVGTLLLAPSAASSLTGGVAVTGGTLALSFANLAPSTNLLPTSNALTLTGGTIGMVEKLAVLASQTFAGLSVGQGLSAASMTRTTGTVRLDTGTISQQAPGGTLTFLSTNTTTAQVKVANAANAYIGPWAIAGDPRSSAGRWAYADASGFVTTISGSTATTNLANVTSGTVVYTWNNASATLAANAVAYAIQNPATASYSVTLGNFSLTTNGLSKLTAFTDTYTTGSSGTGTIIVGSANELVMMGNGNITISAPIVNGTSGNSAVTYVGGGALRIDSKASTYTGPTTVNSGTVRIGTGGSINGSSGVAVNGGKFVQANTATALTPAVTLRSGTVDGTGTINAVTVSDLSSATVTNGDGSTTALTVGSLTFNGDGTINVNTAGSAGLAVTGTLTTTPANGTVTINVLTSPVWTTGSTYNLVGYTAFSGSAADFAKGTIPNLGARQIATLGTSGPTNGFVTLAITGDSLVWTGTTSNLWTTSTTALDWRLQTAGTPTAFIATDDVRFDDTATGSTTIDISAANVSPNSTTFDNATKDYAITSSGGFGIASGVVTKSGTGLVRFDTVNTYTGVTTINGGTLALNSGAAIANTGLVTLGTAAGATLEVRVSETIGALSGGSATGGAVSIPVGQALSLASGTQTYAGAVSGNGALVNAGAAQTITGVVSVSGGVSATSGRLSLGGANTYGGETLVSAGAAVVVIADGALSTTGVGNGTVVTGTGGAVSGVLGFSGVNYTTAEHVTGVGLGNTAAVSGLSAVQRGFVQGVSGSSRFAGDIEISGSGISRIGVQNGAILNLAGAITPAAGVTGVNVVFRAGDTNGDFVILSGTNNAWDNDAAIYTGNNTAGQYSGVRLGASNALPTNSGVYGTSNAQLATTFDLNGFDQRLNGLTGSTQASGGIAQLRITNLAAGGTSTLTLNVTETRSTAFTTLQEVTGGGVLALVKTGTGLQVLGGTNTYSGATTVAAGTLRFSRPVSLYGGTTSNWTPSRITVESGATLAVAVGGTTGEFTASDVATLAANLTTGVNNDGLRAGSFLGLNAGLPTTISTSFTDSTGIGGGAVGIVKSGTGSITLAGVSSYTGPTAVDDGLLAVDGQLGATPVSVAAGATLAGSGTIAGSVSLNGLLTPGNGGVGVITLGGLSLGGTTAFEIGTGSVRGVDYDGVTISTPNTFGYGGTLQLAFTGTVADSTTFDLFSFSGVSTGSLASVVSSGAYAGTWANIGGGFWQLTSGTQLATFDQTTGDLFIVPEPTTCVATIGTAGLCLILFRRRRDG